MTPEELRERVQQTISDMRGSGSHSTYIADAVLRVVAEALTSPSGYHGVKPSWRKISPHDSPLQPWLKP